MFRHTCGFQLANQGTDTRTLQAYLGHRNIQHTVRYTELHALQLVKRGRHRASVSKHIFGRTNPNSTLD